jgi:hypothetical protein
MHWKFSLAPARTIYVGSNQDFEPLLAISHSYTLDFKAILEVLRY